MSATNLQNFSGDVQIRGTTFIKANTATDNLAIGTDAGATGQGARSVAIGLEAGKTNQGADATAIGHDAGLNAQSYGGVAVGLQAGSTEQGSSGTALGRQAGQTSQGASATAVGYLAAQLGQGAASVAVGHRAGLNAQGANSVAMGDQAGETSQGASATAVGLQAGESEQGTYTVAVGSSSGMTSQGAQAVAVGWQAGLTVQGANTTAVGREAGKTSQGASAVAVGSEAGETSQGAQTVAVGLKAGNSEQGSQSVAVGTSAGQTSQGVSAVAIGWEAGDTEQGTQAVAMGRHAGRNAQGIQAVAVGWRAGSTQQGTKAVAVGSSAGQTSQGASAVAVGYQAGELAQGAQTVAVGLRAGNSEQGSQSIAVGTSSGMTSQGASAVAIGWQAGKSEQGSQSVAIGKQAGHTSQGTFAVAVGYLTARTEQAGNAVAVGREAGDTSQGAQTVAVGLRAGNSEQGNYAVAVGSSSGMTSQGASAVAVGWLAGESEQGANATAVGYFTGKTSQGTRATAVGFRAGESVQGSQSIAVGSSSGHASQGAAAIAIGWLAGYSEQALRGVAVGRQAGQTSQGANAVAMGFRAGQTAQGANSIILNASGAAFNATTASSFNVKPVRGGNYEASALAYTSGFEIVEETNMHFDTSGNVGIGTNAPESLLHISASTASADITDPIKLKIHNRTGAADWSITQPWGLLEFDTDDNGTAGNGPVAGIGCRFETSSGGDSSICFYTDNATGNDTVLGAANERMCIDSDGLVGIGTAAPKVALHVRNTNGRLAIADASEDDCDTNAFNAGLFFVDNTWTGSVAHSGNPANGMGFYIAHNSSSSKNISMRNMCGSLSFGTRDATTAMAIDDDGNVGIGTDAPQLKLHVNGGIYLGAETQGTDGFGSATDAANRTRTYIEFGEAGTDNDWCILRQIGPSNGIELSYDFHDDGDDARFSIRQIQSTSTPDSITTRFRVNNSAVTIPGSLTVAGSGVSSDDRIKYNEVDIPNALNLINQLKPQKYEKLVDVSVEDKRGIWIPSDEEWESVKDDHKYVHEFGFIAQAVRNIPDMAFLVTGEETKMMTTTKTPIEYSNMTTDEQDTYTPSYVYKKKSITQEEYSILTSNVQELHTLEYFKETETQSPLSLNYNGLFVIAIGAIQELKAKNYTLETQLNSVLTRLDALETA